MKWKSLHKPGVVFLITFLLSLIPLIGILTKIWLGESALWYDPARDLLAGLANLQKPTLIGPTTGIPGVFYGPYWIWLLSLGESISHDPRIIIFIVGTIPYFVLFPLILFRFSGIISLPVLAILWLYFLLQFNHYFTDLWNPYLAPLLILLAIYFLFSKTNEFSIKNLLVIFLSGFITGLVMNFQLSFGIGMLLGVIIYLVGENIFGFINAKKKYILIIKKITFIPLFLLGCLAAFAPFLLFEVRHQFLQTKTLLNALAHYGGVVGIQGLSKAEIVQQFFGVAGNLLQIPFMFAIGILLLISILYLYSYRQKKELAKSKEQKLLSILGCISFGVLWIYLTAKNPVWAYHFIGVEVLFIFFLGILINKLNMIKMLLGVWVIVLILYNAFSFFTGFTGDRKIIPGTVIAAEKIVEKIQTESNNKEYTVFAYSSSIYTYEYAYLFQSMYDKDVPYRPELNPKDAALVFLVIPPNTESIKKQDFIHFRTSPEEYITTSQWAMSDGTDILKREKIKKETQ